jgi:autophagy-related protein 2
MLNGVWMPDVKSTQLYDFLSGVAPVRSLVRLGSGFRELLLLPLEEYQRDGRVFRGLMQGGLVFAQTTANEVLKFGAKVAAGTQAWLESAEGALGGPGTSARRDTGRRSATPYMSPYSDDMDSEISEQEPPVSLYADQPIDAAQGIRRAYRSLGKNIAMARNAAADIGAESASAGSATVSR